MCGTGSLDSERDVTIRKRSLVEQVLPSISQVPFSTEVRPDWQAA